jgi:hypothetical protein
MLAGKFYRRLVPAITNKLRLEEFRLELIAKYSGQQELFFNFDNG